MRKYGKNTKRIQVRVGERFILELPAVATAGFTWLLNQDLEVAVLTQERMRPGEPSRGAISIQEFEFAAIKSGASTLLLEYKRPWENVTKERREVDIVVKP
jgi:predicted secreted protein